MNLHSLAFHCRFCVAAFFAHQQHITIYHVNTVLQIDPNSLVALLDFTILPIEIWIRDEKKEHVIFFFSFFAHMQKWCGAALAEFFYTGSPHLPIYPIVRCNESARNIYRKRAISAWIECDNSVLYMYRAIRQFDFDVVFRLLLSEWIYLHLVRNIASHWMRQWGESVEDCAHEIPKETEKIISNRVTACRAHCDACVSLSPYKCIFATLFAGGA